MRILDVKLPKEQKKKFDTDKMDLEYGLFFYKCLALKKKIKTDWNLEITNRHLDNILMLVIERTEKASAQ